MSTKKASAARWLSVDERFFLNVEVGEAWECWLWIGSKNRGGYGVFGIGGGRRMVAHRWLYEQRVDPIPEGLVLDHICRVRACVNPAHLRPMENGANVLIGVGLTAINARKTHCIHGHELKGYNVIVTRKPDGRKGRKCRECAREFDRRRGWRRGKDALGGGEAR